MMAHQHTQNEVPKRTKRDEKDGELVGESITSNRPHGELFAFLAGLTPGGDVPKNAVNRAFRVVAAGRPLGFQK